MENIDEEHCHASGSPWCQCEAARSEPMFTEVQPSSADLIWVRNEEYTDTEHVLDPRVPPAVVAA